MKGKAGEVGPQDDSGSGSGPGSVEKEKEISIAAHDPEDAEIVADSTK